MSRLEKVAAALMLPALAAGVSAMAARPPIWGVCHLSKDHRHCVPVPHHYHPLIFYSSLAALLLCGIVALFLCWLDQRSRQQG